MNREILQPDAFCEHTMQENVTAAGAPPWTRPGKLTMLLRLSRWFNGAAL